MPTYEYVCRGCNEHVEVVQSFKDDPLTTCGLCGGQLRKVFSAAGIIFKGSGYYVTDTRGQQATAAGASQSKGDGSATSESSAKTDSADSSRTDTGTASTAAESA